MDIGASLGIQNTTSQVNDGIINLGGGVWINPVVAPTVSGGQNTSPVQTVTTPVKSAVTGPTPNNSQSSGDFNLSSITPILIFAGIAVAIIFFKR